jgi:hypothetical protein
MLGLSYNNKQREEETLNGWGNMLHALTLSCSFFLVFIKHRPQQYNYGKKDSLEFTEIGT